jgi:hypothetical protein
MQQNLLIALGSQISAKTRLAILLVDTMLIYVLLGGLATLLFAMHLMLNLMKAFTWMM